MSNTEHGPGASIVIPCRNEVESIEGCIRSILGQQDPPGGIEIIVADGMSDDGTRDVLARIADETTKVRIQDNPQRIVSAGLNQAIRAARAPVIIRMDAHTEYADDYIRQCVDALCQTRAENVGGPWVAKGRGYLSEAIAAAFQSAFAVGGARGHRIDYTGPVDTVYLGCWFATTFQRFGLFDEELIRNQDDEHNLRIIRSGGQVWQSSKIRSWYTPRNSLAALFRQYRQYGYWKVKVIRKHRLPASIRHLVPAIFVASMVVWGVGAPFLPAFRVLGLLEGGLYLACLIAASGLTAAKAQWRLFWVLPVVFAAYHTGYGVGFLEGLQDFVVLKRAPSDRAMALTRG